MADLRGRIPHVGYSVSYRNRWWKRRWYAAGNLPEAEAVESFENLVRAGFKRVRMEATSVGSPTPLLTASTTTTAERSSLDVGSHVGDAAAEEKP